jgi:hypothetical protein
MTKQKIVAADAITNAAKLVSTSIPAPVFAATNYGNKYT